MRSIRVIVLILPMFVLILMGCESTSPPIQTDNEQVEERILPEKRSMPESSPTPVPTNTPIPLSDINLESALVQPSDLILEGYFVESDLIECPGTTFERNKEFFDLDDDTILNTASISYCTEKWKRTQEPFRERIYLFESIRLAAQFAEKLKEYTDIYVSGNPWFDIETTSINLGENSFWLLRALSPAAEFSYIVMAEDEAVMISEIQTTKKFEEEYIIDISTIMLRAFERSQHP